MIARSKQFWLVGFYLSKFGRNFEDKTLPPIELNTDSWTQAYSVFYEKLADGREIDTFSNSLKNARDAYDSHLQNSIRVGWKANDGTPNPLHEVASKVFEDYSEKTQDEIWEGVKETADLEIVQFKQQVDDLIAIQKVEKTDGSKSQTEGGKKIVISFRYERRPSLRNKALEIHGYDCLVCGFNFQKTYGDWGKNFAEVHHVQSLADFKGEKDVNPKKDLVVLCSNCHSMVHRKKGITLTIDELKAKLF